WRLSPTGGTRGGPNSPSHPISQIPLPLRDGARQQSGELGLGAAEAVDVGGGDVERDVDAAAGLGADTEAAVGATGEGQDGLGAALAGHADAVAGEREGDGAGDDTALGEGHRQALADHPAAREA